MKYSIKTLDGQKFAITQEQRDNLAAILLIPKGKGAGFVEIGVSGNIIATSSISTITADESW